MSILRKAIQNNIMTNQNKYMNDDERVGQVIETNEAENRCTVYLMTRDGITSVEYNVLVKCDKFPKPGDMVEVKEKFKKFTVVGIYNNLEFNTELEGDIYCMYGGSVNGYVGY
jgi:hypothetical protein